jgi:hypothetical protein
MQGPWYIRFLQVVLAADPDIRKETWNGYSYQILLTPEAMIWGMSGVAAVVRPRVPVPLIDWVVLGGKRLRQSRPIEERDCAACEQGPCGEGACSSPQVR